MSVLQKKPEIIVFAGPNGSGKSTIQAYNSRDGVLANENNLKEKADYAAYKDNVLEPMPKFKFRKAMIEEFKNVLMKNIEPLLG